MDGIQAPELDKIQKILWAARMEAASYKWHLNNRAAPPLRNLSSQTGEARLNQAAEHATKAAQLLHDAGDSLIRAIELVEVSGGAQSSQTT
jgi:hypothetical protein